MTDACGIGGNLSGWYLDEHRTGRSLDFYTKPGPQEHKRPRKTKREKSRELFAQIAALICNDGYTFEKAAKKLGITPGRLRGTVRSWELRSGKSFGELVSVSAAARTAEWMMNGRRGPRPKPPWAYRDYTYLCECLERGILIPIPECRSFLSESVPLSRQYASEHLQPAERKRMEQLINYRAACKKFYNASDSRQKIRTIQLRRKRLNAAKIHVETGE